MCPRALSCGVVRNRSIWSAVVLTMSVHGRYSHKDCINWQCLSFSDRAKFIIAMFFSRIRIQQWPCTTVPVMSSSIVLNFFFFFIITDLYCLRLQFVLLTGPFVPIRILPLSWHVNSSRTTTTLCSSVVLRWLKDTKWRRWVIAE